MANVENIMPAPIVNEFLELVRIEVNSRKERLLTDTVKEKLKALGAEVEEDGTTRAAPTSTIRYRPCTNPCAVPTRTRPSIGSAG